MALGSYGRVDANYIDIYTLTFAEDGTVAVPNATTVNWNVPSGSCSTLNTPGFLEVTVNAPSIAACTPSAVRPKKLTINEAIKIEILLDMVLPKFRLINGLKLLGKCREVGHSLPLVIYNRL